MDLQRPAAVKRRASTTLGAMSKVKLTAQQVRDRASLTAGFPATGRLWFKLMESRLGLSGLSGGNTIPLILAGRMPEGTNLAALADVAGMARPSLIRHVDQLCELGLMRRQADVSDRRAKKLILTPEGKAMASELEIQLEDLRREVLGHLSGEDIEGAVRVQRAIADAAAR